MLKGESKVNVRVNWNETRYWDVQRWLCWFWSTELCFEVSAITLKETFSSCLWSVIYYYFSDALACTPFPHHYPPLTCQLSNVLASHVIAKLNTKWKTFLLPLNPTNGWLLAWSFHTAQVCNLLTVFFFLKTSIASVRARTLSFVEEPYNVLINIIKFDLDV